MRKAHRRRVIGELRSNAGVVPEVIARVRERRRRYGRFHIDVPDDNPYIFHPKRPQTAFVTLRSPEKASDVIATRCSSARAR